MTAIVSVNVDCFFYRLIPLNNEKTYVQDLVIDKFIQILILSFNEKLHSNNDHRLNPKQENFTIKKS